MAAETFDQFYQTIYGPRWPELRRALCREPRKCRRLNRFAVPGSLAGLDPSRIQGTTSYCLDRSRPSGSPTGNLLNAVYEMDLGSVFAAEALDVQSGETVLDLCAAPGGKALILAERLGSAGHLVLNEPSKARCARLRRVLEAYLPAQARSRCRMTGIDGAAYGLRYPGFFERVLVDVPCSGEGHLCRRERELRKWSPARTRNLARRQYGLLCSALLAARPGARVVYATCSVSPHENDRVIQRFFKRKPDQARLIPYRIPLGEPSQWGWQLFPDQCGWGPIYFSVLEKRFPK